MEEQEKRKSESQDHPCEEQTHSLSVVLSVEEEAVEMPSDWVLNSAGEDGVANGFGADDRVEGEVTDSGFSPGTSYWSVSEGPGFPLLLPVAGPARGRSGKRHVERASRTGNSRIPGRDHRRYYHEYWRAEFLMDFDAQQHRMLCMVCGSSLATLKLSTIKRHIQQKHPESLLWSAAEKEAIRVGWESHLNVRAPPSPARSSAGGLQSLERELNSVPPPSDDPEPSPDPVMSDAPLDNGDPAPCPPSPTPLEPSDLAPPPAQVLERYVDDSLHAWFRQEFLIEYSAEEARLTCMVCSIQLPSLHLEHIKRHVLDQHPDSLLYSAAERHSVLHRWAQRREASPLREPPPIKLDLLPDVGGVNTGSRVLTESGTEVQPVGDSRSPSGRLPKRWRLGYLVARCPRRRAVVCMVCSQTLPAANARTFRHHIREQHPETAMLTQPERRALADDWGKWEGVAESTAAPRQGQEGLKSEQEAPPSPPAPPSGPPVTPGNAPGPGPAPAPIRLVLHTGRAVLQQRNYQERWRTDYLMEYDSRRHGLVCVACGASLATLKLSTIKRHIQQVHPHTLSFTPAQREEALRNFSHPALATPPTPPPPASPGRTLDSPPEGAEDQE